MKRTLLMAAMAVMSLAQAWAQNTSTSIEQVTEAVTVNNNVDYHITSAEPFTATGSINLTNTDHAVIIFDNLKPSLALNQLGFVKINGEAAVSERNCQVRMYNRGAILFPYGKESSASTGFHPLTVYSEPDCQGEACELFGLENSGGYMNTLTAAKLNNRIRSFTLKRGYMVTFSLQNGGRGYSRCFIADHEDLVVNSLPTLMDSRISSYRVFRWYNASKMGIANDTRAEAIQALNVTSCYDWGTGVNRQPDAECIPNHIYEDWPSSSACGGVTYSCHMKTNNEPGNSSDDHPQTVAEILANWQNLMRTGLRLCSPSSHDGSLAHLRETLDSIDARGWRCDLIDLHCYWPDGSFNDWAFNDQWANKYGRPIWVSEWVWGASWNSNGAFASGVTETQNRNMLRDKILPYMNQNKNIERYFYWNSERDPSKIYKDGHLTPAGEVYASMNAGLAYTDGKNYVPKNPRMYAVTDFEAKFNQRTNACTLSWTNSNGELTDQTEIQEKQGNKWETIATLDSEDKTEFTYEITFEEGQQTGLHSYRIITKDFDKKSRTSNESSFFVGSAINFGLLQVGTIENSNSDISRISFAEQESKPAVFVGLASYRNTANAFTNHVTVIGNAYFNFYYDPWKQTEPVNFKNAETADFLVIQPGNYTWGNVKMEVAQATHLNNSGSSTPNFTTDEAEVFFSQPFDEGVVPVVLVQNVSTNTKAAPANAKVFDITNTGFKVKLFKQAGEKLNVPGQTLYYLAATPGQAIIPDTEKKIVIGRDEENPVGGSVYVNVNLTNAEGSPISLKAPYIIAGQQTHRYDVPSVFRLQGLVTQKTTDGTSGEEVTMTTSMRIRRQVDATATAPEGVRNTAATSGDIVGWLAVADASAAEIEEMNNQDGIVLARDSQPVVSVSGKAIYVNDPTARIFNSTGAEVKAGTPLAAGIYLVKKGNKSKKVQVR